MEDENPILTTIDGRIRGAKRKTIYDDFYYSFERIPFAQPPLGDLRFRAPQPVSAWHEVLDCTHFGDKPLQKNNFHKSLEGSEDCLYLNVYVKALQTDSPLPVMFYIYGGGYYIGEATRDLHSPDYFMMENVILVTCNYRLGPLGFLCLNNPELRVPGNAGLKDQLAALRWFKNNCKTFNGDPNNITVFGNSAGSASVHYLMLTEQAKYLFHKAILMSGTIYNIWANTPHGDYAYRLAKINGYEGENCESDILDFLMQLDGSKLVGHELATLEEQLRGNGLIFAPTTEPYVGDDCIVPENPQITAKNAWSKNMPIMMGGTSFEGLLSYAKAKENTSIWNVLRTMPEKILPYSIQQRLTPEESHKLGQQLLKLHFDDTDLCEQNVFKYLQFISYKAFWHGFQATVKSRLAYAHAPTYLYRFDFDSSTFNLHRIRYCGPEVRGVAHADDLSYLFYGIYSWKLSEDTEEYKMIRRMVKLWTSFATSGNPNYTENSSTNWQPVEETQPNRCLNISAEMKLIDLPEAKKLDMWKNLIGEGNLV